MADNDDLDYKVGLDASGFVTGVQTIFNSWGELAVAIEKAEKQIEKGLEAGDAAWVKAWGIRKKLLTDAMSTAQAATDVIIKGEQQQASYAKASELATERRIQAAFREKEAIARSVQEIKSLNEQDLVTKQKKILAEISGQDALSSQILKTGAAYLGLYTIGSKVGSFFKQQIEDGFRSAIALEAQVARINLLANSPGIERLKTSITSISSNTGQDLSSVSSAVGSALARGQSTEVASLGAQLAQVNGGDALSQTNALITAMNSFGASAKDAGKYANILNEATLHGVKTGENFSETLGKAGLILGPLGFKIEDVAGTLEVLEKRGLSSAQSLSIVANFATRLTAPTDELRLAMARVGATSAQQLINSEGLAHALDIVFKSTKDASEVTELFHNAIGGANRSALSIASAYKDIAEATDKYTKANNSLAESQKKVYENSPGDRIQLEVNKVKNSITQFSDAVVLFSEKVGAAKLPTGNESIFDKVELKLKAIQDILESSSFSSGLEKFLIYATAGLSSDVIKDTVDKHPTDKTAEIEKTGNKFMDDLQKNAHDATEIYAKHFSEVKAKAIQTAIELREQDILTTKNLEDQLHIQMQRWEDSVRQQNEIRERAHQLIKQSVGRVESDKDTSGSDYNRTIRGLPSGLQGSLELNAINALSGRGSAALINGVNGPVQNPVFTHIQDLEQGRDALFSKASGGGEGASKDIELALSKGKELTSIYENQYDVVKKLYDEQKASINDVNDAQNRINQNKQKQIDLEGALQSALKQTEETAKAKADVEQARIKQVQEATSAALRLEYLKDNGLEKKFAGTPEEFLAKFNALKNTALAGTGNDLHANLQIQQILGDKEREFRGQFAREQVLKIGNDANDVRAKLETPNAANADAENFVFNVSKQVEKFFKKKEAQLEAAFNTKLGLPTSGDGPTQGSSTGSFSPGGSSSGSALGPQGIVKPDSQNNPSVNLGGQPTIHLTEQDWFSVKGSNKNPVLSLEAQARDEEKLLQAKSDARDAEIHEANRKKDAFAGHFNLGGTLNGVDPSVEDFKVNQKLRDAQDFERNFIPGVGTGNNPGFNPNVAAGGWASGSGNKPPVIITINGAPQINKDEIVKVLNQAGRQGLVRIKTASGEDATFQ